MIGAGGGIGGVRGGSFFVGAGVNGYFVGGT